MWAADENSASAAHILQIHARSHRKAAAVHAMRLELALVGRPAVAHEALDDDEERRRHRPHDERGA